jgi:hypothetical protein
MTEFDDELTNKDMLNKLPEQMQQELKKQLKQTPNNLTDREINHRALEIKKIVFAGRGDAGEYYPAIRAEVKFYLLSERIKDKYKLTTNQETLIRDLFDCEPLSHVTDKVVEYIVKNNKIPAFFYATFRGITPSLDEAERFGIDVSKYRALETIAETEADDGEEA